MESTVHIYTILYEFAASVGALEGFVYHKEGLDTRALPKWVNNLVSAYGHLPPDVLEEIQASLDQTAGRAVRSLIPLLGEEHEMIQKLRSMIRGALPASPDDFEKRKWFQK